MATEIERKFLVTTDTWRDAVVSETRMIQGYLADNPNATVRVRVAGEQAFLTVKGRMRGVTRSEYEYPIPPADAEAMLEELAISAPVEKLRYKVRCGEHLWDLDVFSGDNEGLVMAEVELASEDDAFQMPEWAGSEVTADKRYYNVNLARHPYRRW
jgi:adenylate cyclase